MKKKLTYSSDLVCSVCGTIFTIPRFYGEKRKMYHIKDMECPNCKKIQKFIELGDASVVKKSLEFIPDLTEFEQKLYDLLHMNEEKEKTNVR